MDTYTKELRSSVLTGRGDSAGVSIRRLEAAYGLLAAALGFVHIWADPHRLGTVDGMSYVDIAETYLRGDWPGAINAYWSPLYSWLIAIAFAIVEPSPSTKFMVVHVLNLGMYLAAFGCFAFLVRELLRFQQNIRRGLPADLLTIPDWAVAALGYAFFIWSSLYLITVTQETPDLLVAAIVYAAAGILLRIRRHPGSWSWFVALGLVLGLGYLTKTVMAPLAGVFLVVAAILTGEVRRAVPRVALAAAMFLVLGGPFMAAISQAKGRPTFGESGRLSYLFSINDVSEVHWQGEQPGHGTPAHPTRRVSESPPIYEFAFHAGSYPPWYDPTYWFEGSVNRFDLARQLTVFSQVLREFYVLFRLEGVQYAMLVGLLILCLMRRPPWLIGRELVTYWMMIIPALAALAAYSMIWVSPRYVAPHLALLWLALFSAIRLPRPDGAPVIRATMTVVIAVVTVSPLASSSVETGAAMRALIRGENPSNDPHLKVAHALHRSGLTPGGRAAVIGSGMRAFWANLAGAQIVAELPSEHADEFWEADTARRKEIIRTFEQTGASVLVAEKPRGVPLSGWTPVEDTDFYVYQLKDR